MGALPKALKRRGHRVMAVAPRYANYTEGWETGVRIRFHIFGKDEEVGQPPDRPQPPCFSGARVGLSHICPCKFQAVMCLDVSADLCTPCRGDPGLM